MMAKEIHYVNEGPQYKSIERQNVFVYVLTWFKVLCYVTITVRNRFLVGNKLNV